MPKALTQLPALQPARKSKRQRNAHARHVLPDLKKWRGLAVAEVKQLRYDLELALRDIAEIDRLIAAVRAA